MKIDKQPRSLLGVIATVGLALIAGCGQEPKGPTTEDFAREREAVKKRAALAAKAKEKRKSASEVASKASEDAGKEAATPSPAVTGAGPEHGFSYDPTGKRDPFRSFMWERADEVAQDDSTGPLEKFDLNQLEVVAVVWRTGNARALIRGPSGESYIVGEGTPVGKNQGHVVSIGDNKVVVKETYVDYLGEETIKDVEMRMRRNEGG